jgi:hypothetical protein
MVVPAKEKEIPKMWLAVVQDRTQSIFGNYYMDLHNDLFLSNAKQ